MTLPKLETAGVCVLGTAGDFLLSEGCLLVLSSLAYLVSRYK